MEEREPVPDDQIRMAQRNESLIIESHVILTYFEKFTQREITSEELWTLFSENKGLLEL